MLAVYTARLVAEAQRLDGVIEFVPQVGDFVAADEPLFRLYQAAAGANDAELRKAVAFGPERTMEQDPMFAFRILVDIAIKALSPAINDPTTAVLSIDQIHRLLRYVGLRHLHGDSVCDAEGKVRVILRTPNWQDFVQISCNEIRACGVSSVQIVRRQRAMLENLIVHVAARTPRVPETGTERSRQAAARLLQAAGGPCAGENRGFAGARRCGRARPPRLGYRMPRDVWPLSHVDRLRIRSGDSRRGDNLGLEMNLVDLVHAWGRHGDHPDQTGRDGPDSHAVHDRVPALFSRRPLPWGTDNERR